MTTIERDDGTAERAPLTVEPPRTRRSAVVERPEARTVTVAGRRTVGYYEYGDPEGAPVLVLHGVPASGAGFAWADTPARRRGVRLVAPDRPGIGRSDRAARRPVADHAATVAAFADALGIDTFAVLGHSGGGPYACAAAYAFPDRVRVAGVVAGAGNVGVWARLSESEPTDRVLSHLSLRAPFVARTVLRAAAEVARRAPGVALASFRAGLPRADRDVLASLGHPSAALALFTEAFGSHGARGVVDDYAVLSRPWGFPVEAIRVPLVVWHGDADNVVPIEHARALVERVPHASLTVWPGAGHLGLVSHIGDVLDALSL